MQYLVHDRAQDVWWISFSRTNVSYTLHVPVFQHALVLDVCWISFLLYFSRKQCNFIVTAQHMMFCKFPSWEQSFLAFTAISSSRYSTSCLLNLLLVNKSFLAYFVFMLQHMMFVEFPSRDYTFLTYTAVSYSWGSPWCLLKFFPHACCALWTSSSSPLIKVDLKIWSENMRIYIVIITTFQT